MDDGYRRRKAEEGDSLMQSGEAHLKTSLLRLKTSPDHDSAAADFEKAAVCFKAAQEYEKGVHACIKAAESFSACQSEFHAGKMYEQAGYMHKELKQYAECGAMVEKAADCFMSAGQTDSACQTLDKCARAFDQSPGADEDLKLIAVKLLRKSYERGQASERVREAVQSLDYAGKILLNLRRYEEALEMTKHSLACYQELGNHNMVFRTGLHVALLNLQLNRPDDAAHAAAIVGTVDSELSQQLAQLVAAFNKGDQATVSAIVLGQNFVYTENEFAKLGKNLTVPEDNRRYFETHGDPGDISRSDIQSTGGGGGRVSIDSDEDLT